ncbi:MAG: metallophosphoesterase [Bacteroidota bacterium]|nr:metallophosphoesterase [Bacteroidota bacterium]
MQIVIADNHFLLLPQKAIFWKEQEALILSDLHLGKVMHFRKAGIALPQGALNDELNCLSQLIDKYHPRQMIIVGDMFHSAHNAEVSIFDIWRSQFKRPDILLIKGNHDIMPARFYKEMDIEVEETLVIDGFAFSHECRDDIGEFCFSGHLHPGVRINGAGKQSIKLPCFHFTSTSCTLPAFGKFTGLAMVKPLHQDKIFIILENEVIRLRTK